MTLPGLLYLMVILCLMLLQARNSKLLQIQSLKKVRLGTIHLRCLHALGGWVSPFADICQRLPMLGGWGAISWNTDGC